MEAGEKTTEKTLVKKLAKIMGKIGVVPKTGFNKFHKYNYTTEADVQAITSNRMAEENLIMIVIEIENETRQVTTRGGNTEFIYRGTFDFQIHDGDSGEVLTMRVSGEGQDAGDKAAYKALTGAHKYALMKLFQISTGDDPEQQEEPPQQNNPQQQPRNNQPPQKQDNDRQESIKRIGEYRKQLSSAGKLQDTDAWIAKQEQTQEVNKLPLDKLIGYYKVAVLRLSTKPKEAEQTQIEGVSPVKWGQ